MFREETTDGAIECPCSEVSTTGGKTGHTTEWADLTGYVAAASAEPGLLHFEAYLNRHLPVFDRILVNISARFDNLEPAQILDRLAGSG